MEENENSELDIEENDGITSSEEVLSDKIRISLNVLQKEGLMIEQYNAILKIVLSQAHKFDIKRITELSLFYDNWATLLEIFDFLEYSKLLKYEGSPEHGQKLHDLYTAINRYTAREATFKDLSIAYTLLREFINLSGYKKDTYSKRTVPLDIDL